jgi:hypothetical protein
MYFPSRLDGLRPSPQAKKKKKKKTHIIMTDTHCHDSKSNYSSNETHSLALISSLYISGYIFCPKFQISIQLSNFGFFNINIDIRVYLLFRWFNMLTGTCHHYSKSTYSSDDLICWRRAHEPTTDTHRHNCKVTYSSDDLIAGRAPVVFTVKSAYSSDDLLADDGLTNPRRAPVVIIVSLPTLQITY